MTDVSDANLQLAQCVLDAFGSQPRVHRHWDEPEEHSVHLADLADAPTPGVTSYATLGLSDWPLMDSGTEAPMRVELVGACASRFELFGHAMSTAAFCIMKDQWFVYPGRIFPDVLKMYYPSASMQHLLFVPPFLWDDRLETQRFPDKTVAWLQAVPISETELRYARRQAQLSGDERALESLFERVQPDVFDLERKSAV